MNTRLVKFYEAAVMWYIPLSFLYLEQIGFVGLTAFFHMYSIVVLRCHYADIMMKKMSNQDMKNSSDKLMDRIEKSSHSLVVNVLSAGAWTVVAKIAFNNQWIWEWVFVMSCVVYGFVVIVSILSLVPLIHSMTYIIYRIEFFHSTESSETKTIRK